MTLHDFFVTNAGQAGLLQRLTEYVLEVTILGFFAMAVFSLAMKGSVMPEHRVYNKIGLGIVAYLASAKIMEEMVPKEAVMPARTVG